MSLYNPNLPQPTPPLSASPAPITSSSAVLPSQIERFMRSSDRAQHAFEALSTRVQELKGELNDTNQKLRRKIGELDHLSGHLLSLLGSLRDGVVAIDARCIIRFFNPTAERLTGKKAADWIGQPLTVWLHSGSPLASLFHQALNGRARVPRIRVDINAFNDRSIPIAATVSTVRDPNQQIIGAVLVLQDLAEVTHLQKEAKQNADLAEIGRLASVVAHEIRNPLGGIQGFAELLATDLSHQPQQKKYADYIVNGVSDLNRIVTNLLTFAKPPTLRVEELDLNALMTELCEGIKIEAQSNAQTLNVQIFATTPCRLRADNGLLRQAFLNLLRNAAEAVSIRSDGAIKVEIKSSKLGDEPAQCITITDNGPGIPPDIRTMLFQPFVTSKDKGTGLGLSTVRKLIQSHGGVITCPPHPGGGTCFTVLLPDNPSAY